MRNWKQIHVLFTIKSVVEDSTSNNLIVVIVNVLRAYVGLAKQKIRKWLVTFEVDGVSTFQGAKLGVIMWSINKHEPFMMGIHCIAQCTNLVFMSLSKFEVVIYVEDLLASLYSYFSSSPKHTFATI